LALGQFLIILLAFITLFQYKRRIFQVRLNLLNILLNVLLIGGIFYYASMLETASGATADYKIATVFPLLSLVMIFLANHYIRKDEKLIRSANRLR
jgi:positive regulator of sigma E activity